MADTVVKIFGKTALEHPDAVAQLAKDSEGTFQPTTYKQLYEDVRTCASGLLSLGVKRGDHVGLISENGRPWMICNLAIMGIGAADVPRGCDTMAQELVYILGFSDCSNTVVQDKEQLDKVLSVRDKLPTLKRVIVTDSGYAKPPESPKGIEILTFQDVMDTGLEFLKDNPDTFEAELEKGQASDLATIIFTSGTTGEPKGVMLSQQNFTHQISCIPGVISVGEGDIWLCVLPVWHSLERIVQYVALASANTLAYSKPIGKILLADFQAVRPTWMTAVPRLWDLIMKSAYRKANAAGGVAKALFYFFVAVGKSHSHLSSMFRGLLPQFRKRIRAVDIAVSILPLIVLTPFRLLGNALVFSKIKKLLGGRFVAGVSGGGALPLDVDRFFSAAGILVLEGYGLTETAPCTNIRLQRAPVISTVGPMLRETEARIVGENGEILPPGEKGVVHIKGKQVMLGYYKRQDKTDEVLSEDGWFNTGDLGMLTVNNELKLVGRVKDTIVLLGGENIEPAPIEQKLKESFYIEQAVALGQDQKYIAALIVPRREDTEQYAQKNSISYVDWEGLVETSEINELLANEISTLVSAQNGFKNIERVYRFKLMPDSFEVGKQLSHKQEVMRHVINQMYHREIEKLFE